MDVLGAAEGTGRELGSSRQSSSAGDRDEETSSGAPETDHQGTDYHILPQETDD